ncbi:MAG: response regulator, partial [Bacteroidales bacterium]
FGGSGLGLVISNKILLKLGSRINLYSRVGAGSTFSFSINCEYKNSKKDVTDDINKKLFNYITDASYSTVSEPNQDKLDNIIPSPKILIAEDQDIIIDLVKANIKELIPDAVFFEANDGNKAIEIHSNEKPDIIFMDIQMPEKDGYTATKDLRRIESKITNKTPIVALTARAVKGEKEKCLKAGMNDFLPKPINIEQIKSILIKFLGKNRENDVNTDQAQNISIKYEIEYKHFNEHRFLQRVSGKRQQFKKYTAMAIAQIETYIANLREAIANTDYNKIQFIAHKIKGISAFMCFEKLSYIAEKIEDYNDKDIKEIYYCFEELYKEFEIVRNDLNNNYIS